MPTGSFTDAEMLTAVGHLENYGYVKRLRTSKGEQRILLQPERLNNLASSFVLEARRNPKGLGALEEKRLLAGGYDFPELKDLHDGRARRAPGLGGAAVPGAQRLFPRDRPAAHGAVSGLPRADQSEEAAGGGGGDRGWRGLYGERPDGERVRLAGGAAGLHAHLHAHGPVAQQRPLRGGRRPGVRIPAGGRTRRRTGLRALLRPQGRPAGADTLPRIVRELPGAAEPDGDALRAGALHKRMRPPAGSVGRARSGEGRRRLRLLQRIAARS